MSMKGHILLVEDDDGWRQTLAQALQEEGYQVTQASDGRQAIALLNQASSEEAVYDLVLTDIVMGDVNGVDVTRAARSQPALPEVILLTGYGSMETAIAAIRAGAFDYLIKPCRTSTLLEQVASAIQHRQVRLRQIKAEDMLQSIVDFVKDTHLDEDRHLASPGAPRHTAQEHDESQEAERYLSVGAIRIDTHRHQVWFEGKQIHVTPTEYAILECLASSAGRVVTYSDIIYRIRGYEMSESEAHSLLRAHIRNLRKKFDRRYLVSVYGVGYMLVGPDELGSAEPRE
jgi:DNA-binding response OmpR family regulator